MYVLKTPRGKLIANTFSDSAHGCWYKSYDYIAALKPSWGHEYWKMWKDSIASAREMGYRVVRCKIVEVDK